MADTQTLQFKPDSFFGGKRIDARPRNVEYEEGTGPGTGRTARRVDPGMGGGLDAFYLSQRYKDLPMSMINREANIRRGQGMMYNPYSGTYQRDSMYNRSGLGYGRGEMPQAQAQTQQPQQPAMSSQQQEWARMAAEKQGAGANVGAAGGAMQGLGKSMTGFNPMFGAGMQAAGAALNAASTGKSPTTPNPYLGTREQNIANAKAAGQFDKVRADYNKKNEATGMVMDEEGNITRNPEIAAKDRAAEKTMMSNLRRGVDYTTSGSTTSFTSPYGRGSVTTYAPGAARPPSMVKDELGRMVPMTPYLKEKDIIQKSQGMTGGSSVLGGNRPAANVIPPSPLRKDEGRNLFPNAIGEKAQFDTFQDKLDEAKKRGAEGMAKSRGKESPAVEQKPLTPSEQRKLTLLENKYKAQGIASDEMKAIDAERSAMMVGRNKLLQEIENQQETAITGTVNPTQYQRTLSPQEIAEKISQLEKLEEAIKENYKKSQELGNKRKIPEDVMKEWLELRNRASAATPVKIPNQAMKRSPLEAAIRPASNKQNVAPVASQRRFLDTLMERRQRGAAETPAPATSQRRFLDTLMERRQRGDAEAAAQQQANIDELLSAIATEFNPTSERLSRERNDDLLRAISLQHNAASEQLRNARENALIAKQKEWNTSKNPADRVKIWEEIQALQNSLGIPSQTTSR